MSEEKLSVVDTDNVLTKEELRVIKTIVSWSKSAQLFFAIFLGLVSVTGFPWLIDFVSRHIK